MKMQKIQVHYESWWEMTKKGSDIEEKNKGFDHSVFHYGKQWKVVQNDSCIWNCALLESLSSKIFKTKSLNISYLWDHIEILFFLRGIQICF
jgi:hypothetical protein